MIIANDVLCMIVSQELLQVAVGKKTNHLYPQSRIIWSITMMYFGAEMSFVMFHIASVLPAESIFCFIF